VVDWEGDEVTTSDLVSIPLRVSDPVIVSVTAVDRVVDSAVLLDLDIVVSDETESLTEALLLAVVSPVGLRDIVESAVSLKDVLSDVDQDIVGESDCVTDTDCVIVRDTVSSSVGDLVSESLAIMDFVTVTLALSVIVTSLDALRLIVGSDEKDVDTVRGSVRDFVRVVAVSEKD
jgi:hypothetical protein